MFKVLHFFSRKMTIFFCLRAWENSQLDLLWVYKLILIWLCAGFKNHVFETFFNIWCSHKKLFFADKQLCFWHKFFFFMILNLQLFLKVKN